MTIIKKIAKYAKTLPTVGMYAPVLVVRKRERESPIVRLEPFRTRCPQDILFMYVCQLNVCTICMVITHSKSKDQPCKVANLVARSQLNREK